MKEHENVAGEPAGEVRRLRGRVAELEAALADQERAAEGACEREETYRQLLDVCPDAVVVIQDERFRFVSPALPTLLGSSSDAFAQDQSPFELVCPDHRQWAREYYDALIAGKDVPRTIQLDLIAADGRLVPTELSAARIRYHGRPAEMILVRDISERRKAENALRQSQAALASIFRAAPTGIGVVRDRVFHQVNDRVCEMLGYTREELLGQDARMVYPSEHAYAKVGREKYRQIAERGTGTVETLWQRKDGTIIDVLLSSTPLDPSDLLAGVTFTVLDITQQRRAEAERDLAEQELRQAQKMEAVGRLAGGVAHDFRNQLTVVKGYCDLLRQESSVDGELRDAIEEIAAAAERATRTTEHLLAFSRKQVLRPEIVDLNEVVASLHTPLARLIGEDIRISVVTSPHLAPVEVDRAQLEQAIVNLAVNARDAMPSGGLLRIETAPAVLTASDVRQVPDLMPGPYALLAVSDTGSGMDEDTRRRAFDPFFTTKDIGKGTGLGLSMVYGFVKQSGGHVDFATELGRGTTFRLYLPRSGATAAPADEETRTEDLPLGTETVLVAEDEDAVLALAVRVLRQCGYTVLPAGGAPEAAALAEQFEGQIDLLVTDVIMPEQDGKELARRVLTDRPDTRVLFISGYIGTDIATDDLLEQETELLTKPFSPAEFAEAVRRVLDH